MHRIEILSGRIELGLEEKGWDHVVHVGLGVHGSLRILVQPDANSLTIKEDIDLGQIA